MPAHEALVWPQRGSAVRNVFRFAEDKPFLEAWKIMQADVD